MAGAADTAKLVASLELKDKFSPATGAALGSISKLEAGFGRLGTSASKGLSAAAGKVKILGAAAAVGLAAGVKGGLSSLVSLEDAVSSVDGAIAQMGLSGQLTGKQVASWANQVESDIEAAFDDKDITAAAANLIRFGKVTPANLQPALTVLADLAAKTGDVDSAAELLTKALLDPTAAAKQLKQAGVVLTKEQLATVKAMDAAGDSAGAQAFVLRELERTTKGAARAMAGPARDAQNQLNDAIEDGQRALAIGFLPLIGRVRTELSKKLADPKVLAEIEGFGTRLAGGFDEALTLSRDIPWATIGEGLKVGGQGAKSIADAFGGLPAETKGTILALAGLNKLTGGAPIKIAFDVVKTGLEQFLGRGATPATPLFVKDVTGGLGAAGAAGVAAGGKGGILNTAAQLIPATIVAGLADAITPTIFQAGKDLHTQLGLPDIRPDDISWPFGPKDTPRLDFLKDVLGNDLSGALGGDANTKTVNSSAAELLRSNDAQNQLLRENGDNADRAAAAIASAQAAAAIGARNTESLLRANLSRPQPVPVVNVKVVNNNTVTARTVSDAMWESDRYASVTTSTGQVRAI